MDNLTHSLVGALIGQAGLKRKTGLAMPALIIGANLPDVDAACFFWLDGVEHLGFRRGITHGPPAMLLLPLILVMLAQVTVPLSLQTALFSMQTALFRHQPVIRD